MKNQYKKYVFCNWWSELERKGIRHGHIIVEVRSVGHKWVYLRNRPPKGCDRRFSKISRKLWDEIVTSRYKTGKKNFRTLERSQYRLNIRNEAYRLGISQLTDCKKVKSHPTKRFGWRYKTFAELESEVLAKSDKYYKEVG